MVCPRGFEPPSRSIATSRLRVCQFHHGHMKSKMASPLGFEPKLYGWEPYVLDQLYDGDMAALHGNAPWSGGWKPPDTTFNLQGHNCGILPPQSVLKSEWWLIVVTLHVGFRKWFTVIPRSLRDYLANGSWSRTRTCNNRINSAGLYHWAIQEFRISITILSAVSSATH